LSVIVGLKAALDFYHAIGPERIYPRIHQLGRRVRDRLREDRGVRLLNASADNFHAGLVSFAAVNGDLKRVHISRLALPFFVVAFCELALIQSIKRSS